MTVLNMTQIEEKQRKLKEQEKRLKQLGLMSSNKMMMEVGRLAAKAGITNIDPEVLFGAFLEIYKRKDDPKSTSLWLEYSKNEQKKPQGSKIAVTFKKVPDVNIREQLKTTGLKWNKFRGEFYGICERIEVEKILNKNNVEHAIEAL